MNDLDKGQLTAWRGMGLLELVSECVLGCLLLLGDTPPVLLSHFLSPLVASDLYPTRLSRILSLIVDGGAALR